MSDVSHIERALRLTRRALVTGESVDAGKISVELGIDRTTLYRHVGKKDELVAEALWSMSLDAWHKALEMFPPGSAQRVPHVLTEYARQLIEAQWFRDYLNKDAQKALKTLTGSTSPMASRVFANVRDLLAQEPPLTLDLDLETLTFTVVRIVESFIYADVIAGVEPNAKALFTVLATLWGDQQTEEKV